jgi:hypothetical protein
MPRPPDANGIMVDGQILSVLNNFRGPFEPLSDKILHDRQAILISVGHVM